MAFKNYMEEAVIGELNEVISQIGDACDCERCREDIVAWALNRLPPQYVVTDLGLVYTKFRQMRIQSKADIVVKLLEAARVVKENPRH